MSHVVFTMAPTGRALGVAFLKARFWKVVPDDWKGRNGKNCPARELFDLTRSERHLGLQTRCAHAIVAGFAGVLRSSTAQTLSSSESLLRTTSNVRTTNMAASAGRTVCVFSMSCFRGGADSGVKRAPIRLAPFLTARAWLARYPTHQSWSRVEFS